MGADVWIGESDENAIVWTDAPDSAGVVVKDMSAFQRLIITALVITAPASGNIAIRVRHSSDYGLVSQGSEHWQTLLSFDAIDAGKSDDDKIQLRSTEVFHGFIKAQSICSEADQTVVFNVNIEGK